MAPITAPIRPPIIVPTTGATAVPTPAPINAHLPMFFIAPFSPTSIPPNKPPIAPDILPTPHLSALINPRIPSIAAHIIPPTNIITGAAAPAAVAALDIQLGVDKPSDLTNFPPILFKNPPVLALPPFAISTSLSPPPPPILLFLNIFSNLSNPPASNPTIDTLVISSLANTSSFLSLLLARFSLKSPNIPPSRLSESLRTSLNANISFKLFLNPLPFSLSVSSSEFVILDLIVSMIPPPSSPLNASLILSNMPLFLSSSSQFPKSLSILDDRNFDIPLSSLLSRGVASDPLPSGCPDNGVNDSAYSPNPSTILSFIFSNLPMNPPSINNNC